MDEFRPESPAMLYLSSPALLVFSFAVVPVPGAGFRVRFQLESQSLQLETVNSAAAAAARTLKSLHADSNPTPRVYRYGRGL